MTGTEKARVEGDEQMEEKMESSTDALVAMVFRAGQRL